MHCWRRFSGFPSGFPFFPFPAPLPVRFGSGVLGLSLTGWVLCSWLLEKQRKPEHLHWAVPPGNLNLVCPFWFHFGSCCCCSRKMSSNSCIVNKCNFHKNEKSSTMSVGLGFMMGIVLDFCWKAKLTFLLAARCLLKIFTKD